MGATSISFIHAGTTHGRRRGMLSSTLPGAALRAGIPAWRCSPAPEG